MTTNSIPIIELPPSPPKSRGRVYGETARELIHAILGEYKDLLQERTSIGWKETISPLFPFLECAQNKYPELIEEIEGIAEGANCQFNDVFALNCRSEILFADTNSDECTSLAKSYSDKGRLKTIIAQNWDWYQSVLDYQVILKIEGHDVTPPIVTFTEAGQLAKIGMNGSGIGLTVNNLNPDFNQIGIPWVLIARKILECNSFTEGLGTILSNTKGHSMNYLLGQVGGLVANIESSPIRDTIIRPNEGGIAHTNHYIEPPSGVIDLKYVDDPFPSTFARLWTAENKLKMLGNKEPIKGIKEILRDHSDHPFSICWHKNERLTSQQQHITCLSLIMELEKAVFHYSKGNPCQNNYEILDFTEFFKKN